MRLPLELGGALEGWRLGEGPLQRRLAAALASAVERHDLLPRTKLPPERVLAAQLGVARTTVSAAYALLERRGLVDRRQGRGTGRHLARYGLVVVIAWIGALKYTTYEAAAIQPLIAHSPVFSWIYDLVSVRTLAAVLGTLEITAAVLIAARRLSPRLSAVGSAMGVLLFASTLSFLFTTPGATAAGGFPVLSVLPGQFLLKDLVLIGVSLWTLGDSLAAARRGAAAHAPPGPGRSWTHGRGRFG